MHTINLKLDKTELYKLNDFIEKIILKKDFKIELIVEEVFTNILTYSKCDFIKVNVQFNNNRLSLEFVDNGMEFNSLLIENPNLPDNIEDTKIGGLGIYLTKLISDELHYRYVNGENHFTIIKEITDEN